MKTTYFYCGCRICKDVKSYFIDERPKKILWIPAGTIDAKEFAEYKKLPIIKR